MNLEQLEHPRHPFFLTLLGLLLLAGIGVVIWTRLPSQSGRSTSGWETIGKIAGYAIAPNSPSRTLPTPDTEQAPTPDTSDTRQVFTNTDGNTYVVEPMGPQVGAPTTPSQTAQKVIQTDTAFDFEDFMRQLRTAPQNLPKTPQAGSAPTPTTNGGIGEVYALLPPELLAPMEANAAKRSAMQEILYAYGNAAGSAIKTYEQMHPNDAETLQKFFDDRSSATNVSAAESLAKDIKAIGTSLQTIQNVPEKAAAAHKKLAESYIMLGEKLQYLTESSTDEDLISRLDAYNKALEPYIDSYVELVTLFSGNGVSFKDTDGGSVFMFQAFSM